MKIPAYLLVDELIVEKYAGKNGRGTATYDDPLKYKARVEPKITRVRTTSGDEIVTNFVSFVNPLNSADNIPLGSRVTFEGVQYRVEQSAQQKGFTLSHIEMRF